MNILFITNVFPNPLEPTKGIFNLHLARGLAQRHQVRVIAPISWRDEARMLWRGDVSLGRGRQVVFDGVEVHHPRFLYPPGVLREHYGWFFWQSIQGTVRRLISTQLPDVVIGYWVHPDGEAAVRVARLAGVPSAVIVGGSDVLLITRRRGRRQRVLDVLRATDAVVTVNHHLKETIVDLGVQPERIHVWHQGIDETLIRPGRPREREKASADPRKPSHTRMGRSDGPGQGARRSRSDPAQSCRTRESIFISTWWETGP